MDKILERHDDVGVAANIVYSDGDGAFKNKDCTEVFTREELKNAFVKGCVIIDSENEIIYKPTGYFDMETSGENAVVGYLVYEKVTASVGSGSTINFSTSAAYLRTDPEFYDAE